MWDDLLQGLQAEAAHDGVLDNTLAMLDGSNIRLIRWRQAPIKKGGPAIKP